jgi:HAD superfamily hydrolase (TIGR01549 family)
VLRELRERGLPTGILTNGWSPLQQEKARRVGFDGPVVVSADVGIQKPKLGAFEALARALGAPLEEIAYVGDTPQSDVAGSLNAGMAAVWLDAEDAEYPEGLAAPTVVIHSLEELLSVL